MTTITIEYIYEDNEDNFDQEDIDQFLYSLEDILNGYEMGADFEFEESDMCFGDGLIHITNPLHSEKEIIDYLNNNTDELPIGFAVHEPFN